MGMTSKTRSAARWVGLSLSAMTAFSGTAFAAGPADLYYERAVMTAADQRCRLFAPNLGSALAMGAAQARGSALRAGIDPEVLAQVKSRANDAASGVACNSPDIATAAARVKTAFEGYSRLTRQDYPGVVAGWKAERLASASGLVWNLSQTTTMGRDTLTFGLAGQDGGASLAAMTRFADGAQPYGARLVMRDPARAVRAYFDMRQGPQASLPLAARVAPRNLTRTWFAQGRTGADPLLVSARGQASVAGYTVWRFPAAAAQALAELDPREAVQVEFLFNGPTGEVVRTAYVEVGDFAVGRAFLNLAQR